MEWSGVHSISCCTPKLQQWSWGMLGCEVHSPHFVHMHLDHIFKLSSGSLSLPTANFPPAPSHIISPMFCVILDPISCRGLLYLSAFTLVSSKSYLTSCSSLICILPLFLFLSYLFGSLLPTPRIVSHSDSPHLFPLSRLRMTYFTFVYDH